MTRAEIMRNPDGAGTMGTDKRDRPARERRGGLLPQPSDTETEGTAVEPIHRRSPETAGPRDTLRERYTEALRRALDEDGEPTTITNHAHEQRVVDAVLSVRDEELERVIADHNREFDHAEAAERTLAAIRERHRHETDDAGYLHCRECGPVDYGLMCPTLRIVDDDAEGA